MDKETIPQELLDQRKSDKFNELLRKRLLPVIGITIFLVIWEVAVRILELPSYLLPTPSEIAITMVERFHDLLQNSWVTAYEMLLGYFLAIAIGVPLAIAITASKTFDNFITPILLFFQTVPKISLAPLFLVWFGVGTMPKVLVAFLISFFPIVIDTAVGLRSISPDMIDLAKSMGATKQQIFTRFRLPTSLPYMFSGLKVASTLAVVGAVVGEFVGADKGLGYMLLVANSNLQTALMFGTIVALTVQGLILFYIIQFLETMLIPWHITVRSGKEQEFGTM
ncbi:MAG: ABC transporter permease [Anaerolineales bacterium]|nr:ABC transporter permease [Anaerolineales bacterium]